MKNKVGKKNKGVVSIFRYGTQGSPPYKVTDE